MKWIFLLIITIVSTVSYAQAWRDSLAAARKSYQSKSYNEALKYYKSAQRLAPKDVDLSEELAQSAYRAAKYDEAAKSYSRLAKKENNSKRKVTLLDNLGRTKLKQKSYADAENAFKQALRMDPANEKARQGLVEAKRKRQQQQKQQQSRQQQAKQQAPKKPSPPQNKKKDDNEQQQPKSSKEEQKQNEQKLADKETERKLDELTRREMETKKRLDGSKGKTNGKAADKDW